MKKITLIILSALVFSVISCKKKQKSNEEESETMIEIGTDQENRSTLIDNDEKSGDCDDFMDDYENWMERYVELIGKYKENPVGLATSPEYTSMSMEMIEWSSKWSSLAIDCAKYPEYESRFNEIQEKADKELKAMGID